MTLDETLHRLALAVVVTGYGGPIAPDWLLRRLDEGLGGVCWFAHNVTDVEQARTLSDQLHGVRDGVVVMSDEEGGDVTRLEAGRGSSWPGHAALGALDDVGTTRAVAVELGLQLRRARVDIALSPVVDVNSNPDNPVIGVRSFGSTPGLVARHGRAFVDGLQSVGVAGCAKHFPGHGSTVVDSHLGLPTVDDPEDVVRARDLAPFAAVVEAGVRSVMTAHVVFAAFGDEPATLSPRLLGLLRDELGFDGVIVSDALDMKAISARVGHGEGAVLTLLAGTDLICIGNPSFPEGYDAESRLELVVTAVTEAVRAGRLPVWRLEQAARRVAQLTRWAAEPRPGDGLLADAAVGAGAAGRAVRRQGDVAVSAPAVLDLGGDVNIAAGRRDHHLADALCARDGHVTIREVAGADELAKALADTAGRDLVVVARTPRAAATRALVRRVLDERPDAVVVQTGVGDDERTGDRMIWTFGGGRAMAEAAADLLLGKVPT